MKQIHSQNWLWRSSGAIVAASLMLPLVGCGSRNTTTAAPPTNQARPSMGLSTKQKVVLLAGAAAMYYYYNKSRKANEAKYSGQKITYYRSQNGAIYYREPGNPQKVIWVTPPTSEVKPVRLPENEADQYSDYRGYNGSQTGKEEFSLR